MPRRGSRAWLIKQLAIEAACAEVDARGPPEPGETESISPEDWHDFLRRYSTEKLRKMAAGLTVTLRNSGRPKGSRRYNWEFNSKLVPEVKRLRVRHSERSASEIVARLWGVDSKALRMRYRRARKR